MYKHQFLKALTLIVRGEHKMSVLTLKRYILSEREREKLEDALLTSFPECESVVWQLDDVELGELYHKKMQIKA